MSRLLRTLYKVNNTLKKISLAITRHRRGRRRERAQRDSGNGVSNDSESQSAGGEKFQTSSATRALALRPRRARTVRFMLTGTSAAHVPQDAGFLLGRDASLTVFLNSVWHGGLQCACASCVELNFHTHTACSRTPRMPSLRCAGRASIVPPTRMLGESLLL